MAAPTRLLEGRSPRFWLITAFALSVAALAVAYGSELFFSLRPCEMCYWQRVPYGVVIVLALVGLFLRQDKNQRAMAALCVLTFILGSSLGIFHAGVEWKWWEGPSACSGGIDGNLSAAEILLQIQGAAIVSCSDAAVRILGLSMAGWNALYSLGCAVLLIHGLIPKPRSAA